MARKTEKKTIGEHRFQVTQLGFGQGRRLLTKLAKVLAPAAGELAKASKNPHGTPVSMKSLMDVDVSKALSELADRLDDELLEEATSVLGSQTLVGPNGSDKMVPLNDVAEELFAGDYGLWISWLRFALEVNYARFFASLGVAAGGVGQPAKE
jgi:hypothetical protein